MVSGIALLILICLAVNRLTEIKFEKRMFNSLAKLLATILTVDLFFLFSEVLTGIWPSSATPGHLERLALILTGKYSPLFLSEIFLFGVLPFFLLAIPRTRKSTGIQILACSFILVGVFIKRFMFIVMGFALSPIGPVKSSYVPTLVELLVGAGVWAVGALVFVLAVKLLPVKVPAEHHPAEKAA
jgi:molybdopterin-containing oxidoreductase family membrane subunit